MGRVRFSGPVKSDGGFEIGSGIGTNTSVINSAGKFIGSVSTTSISLGGVTATSWTTQTLTSATNIAVNFTTAPICLLTPTSDITLTATGGYTGQLGALLVTSSGTTTARTLTFSTGFAANGTLATSTTNAKNFTIAFINNGTSWVEISRVSGGNGF